MNKEKCVTKFLKMKEYLYDDNQFNDFIPTSKTLFRIRQYNQNNNIVYEDRIMEFREVQ